MTQRRRTTSARHGFTLIEVLAALVLIGVVLPVAMRGVSIALITASRAKRTSEATELCRSKLSEIALAADASGYTGSGDFGVDWPGYTWACTSVSREYGVYDVTVNVKWRSRGQEESVALTTMAYPGALATGSTTSTDSTNTTGSTGGSTP